MGLEEADQLQAIIEKAKAWPVWSVTGPASNQRSGMDAAVGSYGYTTRDLQLWVAMRESDRARIKGLIDWPSDRDYRVDPLADRIAQAKSDLLFGEEPSFKASDEKDQEQLEELIDENQLPSELKRAAGDCASEGEVWYRIYTDPAQSDWPLVEFHSRLDVIPLWRGRRVMAAAFVSHIAQQEVKSGKGAVEQIYWRHIEIQTDGLTRNLLYRGTVSTLGTSLPLTEVGDTADFPDEWSHDLPVMLAGRIPNKLGRDHRLGISDYQGIKDLLLDLNEARTIMAENARLTAKKRMVVPMEALRDGKFDAGQDVIVHEALDKGMGEDKAGPYMVLEYSFEAGPLKEHINELRSAAITGVGLVEQFIGIGTGFEGEAGSGTSLRTRLIPATLTANGHGRFWDDEVPQIVHKLMLVSSLNANKLGAGKTWADPTPPAFERSSVLPEDTMEKIDRHSKAVTGEIESIETAVRDLHPDWDDKEIEAELDRIKEDRGSGALQNFEGHSDNPNDLPGGPKQPFLPPGESEEVVDEDEEALASGVLK